MTHTQTKGVDFFFLFFILPPPFLPLKNHVRYAGEYRGRRSPSLVNEWNETKENEEEVPPSVW